jgi:hypothetical protein
MISGYSRHHSTLHRASDFPRDMRICRRGIALQANGCHRRRVEAKFRHHNGMVKRARRTSGIRIVHVLNLSPSLVERKGTRGSRADYRLNLIHFTALPVRAASRRDDRAEHMNQRYRSIIILFKLQYRYNCKSH